MLSANLRKVLVAVALIAPSPSIFANLITDWNENTVTLVTAWMAPAAGQRVVAIVQTAMFDAVNSIERRYQPYLLQLPAAPTASQEAAAATAAGTVLAALIPDAVARVKPLMASYLASIPNSETKSKGIELGQMIAAKHLEARLHDGSD